MSTSIAENRFVLEVDAAAAVMQYMRSLHLEDLAIELIQNDLDANASKTVLSFADSKLVCSGDGEPVTPEGWKRLRLSMGAGYEVAAKKSQIGVKNHGLKCCFLLGDYITIRSGGQYTVQTLYRDGEDAHPVPGAFPSPQTDPNPIQQGTTLEVEYRKQPLVNRHGEEFILQPLEVGEIENLFKKILSGIAVQIIGALRPEIRTHYTLELRHHRIGSFEIQFNCKRPRMVKGYQLYRRSFEVRNQSGDLLEEYAEECALIRARMPHTLNRSVPEFYKSGRIHFHTEISWPIDKYGIPQPQGQGSRRYPLGYRADDSAGRTGTGVAYSGPYQSDVQRGGIVENDPLTEVIDQHCRNAMVDLLKAYIFPRYGASGFALFDTSSTQSEDELYRLVLVMLEKRAVPLASPRNRNRGYRHYRLVPEIGSTRFGPRTSRDSEDHSVVMPCLDREDATFLKRLAFLCPDQQDLIHPVTPPEILEILVGMVTDKDYAVTSFDADDALQRFNPEVKPDYFQWESDLQRERELSTPLYAEQYLNLIHDLYETAGRTDSLNELADMAQLPDTNGHLQGRSILHTSSVLPPELNDVQQFPLIHQELADHPLFQRRRAWMLPKLTLTKLFDHLEEGELSDQFRQRLWRWIKTAANNLKRQDLVRLAKYRLWPDATGELLRLSDLCLPEKPWITKGLGEAISIPHRDVVRIKAIRDARGGSLKIRSLPSLDEMTKFVSDEMDTYDKDRVLEENELQRFIAFENFLIKLASFPRYRSYLRKFQPYSYTLNQNNVVSAVEKILIVDSSIEKLALDLKYLAKRKRSDLYSIDAWSPQVHPTREQILDAIQADPHNNQAHKYRIKAYLEACRRENIEDPSLGISEIEFLPIGKKWYAPIDCAFPSGTINYWGNWKKLIKRRGLSANDQKLYTDIGVFPGKPDDSMSVAFFNWLYEQDEKVIRGHADTIIRHLNHHTRLHDIGWFSSHSNIACIPVTDTAGKVYLRTPSQIADSRANIFLADFLPMERAIRETGNSTILFILEKHPRVTQPITGLVKQLGANTLRKQAATPIAVEGVNAGADQEGLLERLDFLRSSKMQREFQKRLTAQGLSQFQCKLKHNWHELLGDITDVRTAERVLVSCKIGRLRVEFEGETGIDPEEGILWLRKDSAQIIMTFFSRLADLIFEHPAPYLAAVLREVTEMDFREAGLSDHMEVDEDEADILGIDTIIPDDGDTPGHTKQTHGIEAPNPSQNVPSPTDFSMPKPPKSKPSNASKPKHGRGSTRQHSAHEEAVKAELKAKHYAYHCQICLAEREPSSLAPINSYVENTIHRKYLIDAHHPGQVHAMGRRDEGNLVVICKHHHHRYGDAFSRRMVTEALEAGGKERIIEFTGGDTTRAVEGIVITLHDTTLDEEFSLFFTKEHASRWLELSKKSGGK